MIVQCTCCILSFRWSTSTRSLPINEKVHLICNNPRSWPWEWQMPWSGIPNRRRDDNRWKPLTVHRSLPDSREQEFRRFTVRIPPRQNTPCWGVTVQYKRRNPPPKDLVEVITNGSGSSVQPTESLPTEKLACCSVPSTLTSVRNSCFPSSAHFEKTSSLSFNAHYHWIISPGKSVFSPDLRSSETIPLPGNGPFCAEVRGWIPGIHPFQIIGHFHGNTVSGTDCFIYDVNSISGIPMHHHPELFCHRRFTRTTGNYFHPVFPIFCKPDRRSLPVCFPQPDR